MNSCSPEEDGTARTFSPSGGVLCIIKIMIYNKKVTFVVKILACREERLPNCTSNTIFLPKCVHIQTKVWKNKHPNVRSVLWMGGVWMLITFFLLSLSCLKCFIMKMIHTVFCFMKYMALLSTIV